MFEINWEARMFVNANQYAYLTPMYGSSLTPPFSYNGYAIGGTWWDDDNYLEAQYLPDNNIDPNFRCYNFSLTFDSGSSNQ